MITMDTRIMDTRGLVEKFIYSCSHDLRAPVSSIQGLVRIAEYYPHGNELKDCLEMIEACTYKMDRLIRTLEEYMVNNHHPAVIEKLNTEELIQEVVYNFKNQLDACDIEVIQEVKPSKYWIMDSFCAKKILSYLISNSLAFYDPLKKERKIKIVVKSTARGSQLEVSDNGIGISQEQQENIFDLFYRGTELSTGTGMGLFLAKNIAEKLGAVISCRSVERHGTTILLSIPKTGLPDSGAI